MVFDVRVISLAGAILLLLLLLLLLLVVVSL